MKSKTLIWDKNLSARKVASLFREGGVVAGASDTVPGLYAMATKEGFLSLNFLKKRSKKPYILLISGQEELKNLVQWDFGLQIENIMSVCWPGPLTIVFKAKKGLPAYLVSDEGAIALRMPNHALLLELLKITGPLFSTSANKAGDPLPQSLKAIDKHILESVAAVLDDG